MVDGKEMTTELASDLHIWVVVCVNTHNFLKIFLFCFFLVFEIGFLYVTAMAVLELVL